MYNNRSIDDSELDDHVLASVAGGAGDGATMNAGEVDYGAPALALVRNPETGGSASPMTVVPVTYYMGPASKVEVKKQKGKHGQRGKRHLKTDDMSKVG